MPKERFQNPSIGDDIRLRLLTYNSNNLSNVEEIHSVNIFFLDPAEVTEDNPTGKRLVQSIPGTDVLNESTGQYAVDVNLEGPLYTIGKYIDEWKFTIPNDTNIATINQNFRILPSLWYTSDKPIVYDFNFKLYPNKIKMGSVRYLIIDITPNVPTGNDMEKYYANLAIASPIRISIEQACGDCMPEEKDLRLMVDNEYVEHRDNCKAYYHIDTREFKEGIYNVWFQMDFGGNIYISDKQQIQIF